MCFKVGLYWQGLVHDLSKYSYAELKMCKYWTGVGSPHQSCREAIGYSPSWMHHYHKNKHHFQYWWDESEDGKIIPVKMPYKYVLESFCDMVGASKAYNPHNWKPGMLLDYWTKKCKGKRLMNPDSERLLDMLITNYYDLGEKEFLKKYKQERKDIKKRYGK